MINLRFVLTLCIQQWQSTLTLKPDTKLGLLHLTALGQPALAECLLCLLALYCLSQMLSHSMGRNQKLLSVLSQRFLGYNYIQFQVAGGVNN